jgi:hypothetical protein
MAVLDNFFNSFLLANSGLTTASCGVPCSVGCHPFMFSITPAPEHLFHQLQDSAIGDFLSDALHQSFVPNGVEVGLQIRIHYPMRSALL